MQNHFSQYRIPRFLSRMMPSALFLVCGVFAFSFGLWTVQDVQPIDATIAQANSVTTVNILLQMQPVDGSAPVPIEVTPFMNSTNSALLYLQEIHTGYILPLNPENQCRTTNSLGRCSVSSLPVGPDTNAGVLTDRQYDILLDANFIEFLTGLAVAENQTHVRFDQSLCTGSTTSFTGTRWCLTKTGGRFANEYFVTITLAERNDCAAVPPPDSFCDTQNRLVHFACSPSFGGATRPWEPVTQQCQNASCPDGTIVAGECAQITQAFSACSTSNACRNHALCSVTHFGGDFSYNAGIETMVLQGVHFGTAGGTIGFPTAAGGIETVEVSAGADWSDTTIRVAVPQNAVSGPLQIHPFTHGFREEGDALVPVTCTSPTATIRSFTDQFTILSVSAKTQEGVRLLAPGFTTTIEARVHHNDDVHRLQEMTVALVQGAFSSPDALPLDRVTIASHTCSVQPKGDRHEALLSCDLAVPEGAASFQGPATIVITIQDDERSTEQAVLLAARDSVLAGDVNMDGVITITDVVLARRMAKGTQAPSAEQLLRDTDGDGAITMTDVIFILHVLTGS